MDKTFIIKEISSGLYLGEEELGSIHEALLFDSTKDAQDTLKTEVYKTGYYEIIPVYHIDAEQRRENEEYQELQEHIQYIVSGVKDGMRIQNGEGTNWVGYFIYKPEYEEKITRWFRRNEIKFENLKINRYYKVTGWDKTIEQVPLQYIKEHVSQHTLDTRSRWISSILQI